MTQIVQEGIEPLLIGTSLLQRIEFQAGMQTVFPAIEPLRAEEAGDGMDLPIYNINIGGAQSFGVTVKWSVHTGMPCRRIDPVSSSCRNKNPAHARGRGPQSGSACAPAPVS